MRDYYAEELGCAQCGGTCVESASGKADPKPDQNKKPFIAPVMKSPDYYASLVTKPYGKSPVKPQPKPSSAPGGVKASPAPVEKAKISQAGIISDSSGLRYALGGFAFLYLFTALCKADSKDKPVN